MSVVKTNKEFVKTLASLSLAEQRYLGTQFIFSVLNIIDEPRLKNIMNSINKKGNSAEELHSAYKLAHSFYIETHPHSGFEELDFKRQAIHMVAEACISCLAPVYQEVTTIHLAQKVAMYCRMAITCWYIPHDQESPSFSLAEIEVKNITQIQYTLVNDYIESRH